MIARIVSGGQSGVDFAALRAAKACGIPTGGWAPNGWLTEDGPCPSLADFGLVEMPTADYPARTRKNVEEADRILVILPGPSGLVSGGTALTLRLARSAGKPCEAVVLTASERAVKFAASFLSDLACEGGDVLIAGPRESKCPGIGALAERFLLDVFARLGEDVVP